MSDFVFWSTFPSDADIRKGTNKIQDVFELEGTDRVEFHQQGSLFLFDPDFEMFKIQRSGVINKLLGPSTSRRSVDLNESGLNLEDLDIELLILGGQIRLKLKPEVLATHANCEFFLGYVVDGEIVAAEPMPIEDGYLVISKEIFPDDPSQASQFKLAVFNPQTGEQKEIDIPNASFRFPDEEFTWQLTKKVLAKLPERVKDIVCTILSELNDGHYLESDNFHDWLRAKLGG